MLEQALNDYDTISAYQPVINGVGGNLVAIYSSRLSTEIARDPLSHGKWSKWAPIKFYKYPIDAFFGSRSMNL